MTHPISFADGRPRVHIWPSLTGEASWSVGPVGKRKASTSPGGALDTAIETLGMKPMVVIVEALL